MSLASACILPMMPWTFLARRPRNDPKVYGQLCWGNASLLSFLTTTVQKMLRAKPLATMVSISRE